MPRSSGRWRGSFGRVKAPPNFEAAVLARIQARHATRRRFWVPWLYRWEWFSWRSAAVGISVAAALLLAVLLTLPWVSFQGRPAGAENELSASGRVEGGIDRPMPAVQTPGAKQAGSPLALSEPHLPAFEFEDGPVPIDAEPADAGFVEYMVPGPGDRPVIMRLPRSVRMRYGPPSEEYFMRNVSH